MKLQTRYATGKRRVRTQMLAADAFVHPRTAALLRAGVEIDVETSAPRSVGIEDVVEANVRVVGVEALALDDANAIEAFGDAEHAGHDARQRKVGAQRFLRQLEALALEPFGVEADIPGFELAPGEGA